MCDIQAMVDRFEIETLRGEFTDASMMCDWDRFASLFTEDGIWRMPHAEIEIIGRDQIRTEVERLRGRWQFFVQNTHPGVITLTGDTAEGRAYITEFGQFGDGALSNYALYHDRYRRTEDGWKFAERRYQVRYLDTTPLPGSVPDPDVKITTRSGR